MMGCQHDLAERETACADGMCPICQALEIERLQEADKLREAAFDAYAKQEQKDRAEIERLREELHYCNGTCDLAMKHRDAAEAEVERLRGELAAERERYARIAHIQSMVQRMGDEKK